MQRGVCSENECGQFSISVSNGEFGLTARFDSEEEFRRFLEEGCTKDFDLSDDVKLLGTQARSRDGCR